MIKERWLQLSIREQQTVKIGGIFLILLMMYFAVWSPLTTSVTDLKIAANENTALLHWMEDTDQKIELLQKNSSTNHARASLSMIQQTIQHSDISNNLSDMQQKERDSVQLVFKEVNFDQLMTWLIDHSSEGWIISEFSITKTSKPGMVSARFQLRF